MKKGLTLVEIMVVSAILLVIVAMLSNALIQTREIFATTDISATLQGDSRLAISRIAADLRRTSRNELTILKDTPFAASDTLQYHLPQAINGTPTTAGNSLLWDAGDYAITVNPVNNRLIRTDPDGNTTILAQNIAAIQADDFNTDNTLALNEISIVVRLQKEGLRNIVHNFNATSTINMRN